MTYPGVIELGANQITPRPYRGGSGIARLRGIPHTDPYTPEDFVGSSVEVFGGGAGLTRLDDGTLLRDAQHADPRGFFGEVMTDRDRAEPEVLVKLLSTDERLFIHAHPDDAFARGHLNAVCGKTEAWIIVATDTPEKEGAYVLLGFDRDVEATELTDWFERQDVDAMAAAMHRLPVEVGDTVHVPAGVPHGIGPGITLVELQQPTDLSILLEYDGYQGLDRSSALLGLPRDVALGALRRDAVSASEISRWRSRRARSGRVETLFPDISDPFYRASRVHPGSEAVTMPQGFAIVVTLEGSGELEWQSGTASATAGRTFLVRHDAGPVRISPGLGLLWCRPPAPRDAV